LFVNLFVRILIISNVSAKEKEGKIFEIPLKNKKTHSFWHQLGPCLILETISI
jgi:hypothetical protein